MFPTVPLSPIGPHSRVLPTIQGATVVLVHQLIGLLTGAWCCPHDPFHRLLLSFSRPLPRRVLLPLAPPVQERRASAARQQSCLPSFATVPITQAWVDLEHHHQHRLGSKGRRRHSRLRYLSVTVTLQSSETRPKPDPRRAPALVTSSPQHGSSHDAEKFISKLLHARLKQP